MTAIVTGATGGIGKYIALGLVRAGHHVVMLGRSAERGAATRAWIAGHSPTAKIDFVEVDLASLAATAAVAASLRAQHPQIALLVNNAGIFLHKRETTAEGRDAVLATNLLSPHLLSQVLLGSLTSSARIVNVGSSTSDRAQIDPDDLEFHRRRWAMRQAYSQSKLALMMITFDLAERLAGTGITANVVHPGMVATGIVRAGGPIGFVWRRMAPFLLTPEQGADTPLHACLAPDLAGVTKTYFKARRPAPPNPLALDRALVARVVRATERLVKTA